MNIKRIRPHGNHVHVTFEDDTSVITGEFVLLDRDAYMRLVKDLGHDTKGLPGPDEWEGYVRGIWRDSNPHLFDEKAEREEELQELYDSVRDNTAAKSPT